MSMLTTDEYNAMMQRAKSGPAMTAGTLMRAPARRSAGPHIGIPTTANPPGQTGNTATNTGSMPSTVPPAHAVQQSGMQGGMSRTPTAAAGAPGTPPAGAQGVLPSMAEGGAIDDTSGFGGVANDDNSSAFDTIDQVVQYGRRKNGLTDGWRRSDNIDDGRADSPSGFTALAMKESAGGDQKDINGNTKAIDPLGKVNDAIGGAAAWGINRLRTGGEDDSGDSATAAIPGTLAADAGYNDIQSNYPPQQYKNGGAVKSYDDGGSVDDDDADDDSTGAIPDNGDADSDDSPSQQAQQGLQTAPDPQRIVSYLRGADAAPPPMVAALERSIDPQGTMDPDTRHAMAIQQAKKQGGDDAAWGVLQHYRQKYDAYRSFSAAALNGVGGKPPDITAAAQAATQAYTYMPDGTTVNFQPTGQGITATVKRAGQDQPFANYNLNPQQFNAFVRGKSGQFDNVYENGPQVLQQLQQSQGQPFDQQQGQQQGGQQQGQPQPGGQPQQPPLQGGANSQPMQGGSMHPPPAQSVYDFSGTNGDPQAEARRQYGYAAPERKANWDKQIEARAVQMFPNDKQKQLAWQAEQEQQQSENETANARANRPWEVPKAKAQAEGRARVANTYTQSRERIAEGNNITKSDIALANRLANSGDRRLQADARLVASAQNAARDVDPDTDEGKAVIGAAKRLRAYQYGQGGQGQQQQPSQQQQPQQGASQQPPAGHPNARKPAGNPNAPWYEKNPRDGKWYPIQ